MDHADLADSVWRLFPASPIRTLRLLRTLMRWKNWSLTLYRVGSRGNENKRCLYHTATWASRHRLLRQTASATLSTSSVSSSSQTTSIFFSPHAEADFFFLIFILPLLLLARGAMPLEVEGSPSPLRFLFCSSTLPWSTGSAIPRKRNEIFPSSSSPF